MSVAHCECGCGELAPLAKQTYRKRGHIKGQPMKFVKGHNGKLQCNTIEGLLEKIEMVTDQDGAQATHYPKLHLHAP